MIKSFKHRGLKHLFEKGDTSKVRADQVAKIRRVLQRLNAARTVDEVDAPSFKLHPLKGNLRGLWAVSVSGNWRVAFRFEESDAFDVNLIDYH
jgi:proteic killer suppression protein